MVRLLRERLNEYRQQFIGIVDFVRVLSDDPRDRIVPIRGPPGTGKTTVIAESVKELTSDPERSVWLIAQSNVAVKNIAEKLADVGFLNWKLLVSTDFHVGWFVVLVSACWALSLIIYVGMSTSMVTS